MALWKPDPTFYPSARMAMAAPPETLAYRRDLQSDQRKQARRACARSISTRKQSSYGNSRRAHRDAEASATSCITSDGMHAAPRCAPTRRIRTSSAVTLSFRGCAPRASTSSIPSRSARTRDRARDRARGDRRAKTGYSRPHTIHCGPDAIYVSALGAPNGDGPGGIFLLDHESFDVLGRWEVDRGPQYLAYDFWWHLGHDIAVTSEWGTPNMIENGVVPDLLLGNSTAMRSTSGICASAAICRSLDLGAENQMALELRPAHDPTQAPTVSAACHFDQGSLGFGMAVASRGDHGNWAVQKVIEIPAEPADPNATAARAKAVQGGAAAHHRYQPESR